MLREILFSWPTLPEMSSLWMPGWSSIHSAHSLLTHHPPSEELIILSTQALHFEHGFCGWVFLSFLVCLPQCYPEGDNHDLAISDSFPFITVGTICNIFWIQSNWCKFETRLSFEYWEVVLITERDREVIESVPGVTKGCTTWWERGHNTIRGVIMKEINLFPVNSARLLRPLNKLVAVGLAVRTVFAVVTPNPLSLFFVIGGLFCFRELSLSCHISYIYLLWTAS